MSKVPAAASSTVSMSQPVAQNPVTSDSKTKTVAQSAFLDIIKRGGNFLWKKTVQLLGLLTGALLALVKKMAQLFGKSKQQPISPSASENTSASVNKNQEPTTRMASSTTPREDIPPPPPPQESSEAVRRRAVSPPSSPVSTPPQEETLVRPTDVSLERPSENRAPPTPQEQGANLSQASEGQPQSVGTSETVQPLDPLLQQEERNTQISSSSSASASSSSSLASSSSSSSSASASSSSSSSTSSSTDSSQTGGFLNIISGWLGSSSSSTSAN